MVRIRILVCIFPHTPYSQEWSFVTVMIFLVWFWFGFAVLDFILSSPIEKISEAACPPSSLYLYRLASTVFIIYF